MPLSSLPPIKFALQALLTACVVGWVIDVPRFFGIALYTEQFLAAALAFALALAFLLVPAVRRADERVAWWDVTAAALGLACGLYVATRYPQLVTELVQRPPDGIAVSAALILLVLEATRRTAGWTLVAVVLVMAAYALLGHLLPGQFASRPVDLTRLIVYLGIDSNALFGTPLQVATIVVVPFVLMGQILARCGGGDFFTDLAMALMGRFRGGAAKISVVGSALFGMVSGSAVANVASVGVVTIPLMQRSGFPAQIAASIEAVGSTGGQLMPPVMGAAAFLMAEYLQVPYGTIMTAAIIPAGLYYLALFAQVDLEAARLGIAGAPVEGLPRLTEVLKRGWHFPIPFALLIGGLIAFRQPPEYAALMATAVLIVFAMIFGYRGKRLAPRAIVPTIVSTGAAVVDMIMITAAAGLVIGILNLTGLAFALTLQLLAVSAKSLVVLLLLTAAVATVLGMGMPTVGVYVILATLAAPALIESGISNLQAHMFVMYFGMMSMVTPPVALAAFAAANIAGADPWRTGWTAVRIGWCAYVVPFLFVMSRHLFMEGTFLEVLWSSGTAALGVWFGSMAVVGYARGPIGPAARLIYMASAIALLIPGDAFAGAYATSALGFLVAVALLIRQWRKRSTAATI